MSIVIRSSAVLGIEVDEEGALEIAKRSRGTPRLANRLLKRVRDFAEVEHQGKIDYNVAKCALDKLDVDGYGLDDTDRNILMTIIKNYGGGPVGIDVLSAAIGEDAGTIEDVYEPYLIKNGLINRTPRGRVVTEKAYKHLNLDFMLS
jgi:Holliday junction DNA helicase RuvB